MKLDELRRALISIVLINAGFLLFSYNFDLARPILNIDYSVVLLLLTLGRYMLAGVFSIFLLIVDVLVLLAQVVPFPRIGDLVYLIKLAPLASGFHLILIIVVALILLVKLASFIWIGRRVSFRAALLLLNALLFMQIALVYVFDRDSSAASYSRVHGAPIASQAMSYLSMRSDLFLEYYKSEAVLKPRDGGAADIWYEELENQRLASRLLLVVVESWGVPIYPEVQDALLAPLKSIGGDSWAEGLLSGNGSTVDAELRELCRLHSSSYNLADVKEGLEFCLPNRLKEAGYATAAIHGATGLMYDRHAWYPRAGFEHREFFESRVWPRRCFSFPGACDLDVRGRVSDFFEAPGPRLLYWLTLNSHSPYDHRDILIPSDFDCQAFSIDNASETCRNLLLQSQFFTGLAQMLKAPHMVGTDVIVVGDHVPVMMNVAERRRNFRESEIPWVRFTVKHP